MVKDFSKSLSNISTTSDDSGIFHMEDFVEAAGHRMNIGDAVEEILVGAQKENRMVCGFNNVSIHFRITSKLEHSLFFFIAPSVNGNSLSHMQEIILQAHCLDNDIYIVKLDSAEKLNKILGSTLCDDTCALVQRSAVLDLKSLGDKIDLNKFTERENILIDICEEFWSESVPPVIRLPEK